MIEPCYLERENLRGLIVTLLQPKSHLHFRLYGDLPQTDRSVVARRLITARRVLHHVLRLRLIAPAPRTAVIRPTVFVDGEHAARLRVRRPGQIARLLLRGL